MTDNHNLFEIEVCLCDGTCTTIYGVTYWHVEDGILTIIGPATPPVAQFTSGAWRYYRVLRRI